MQKVTWRRAATTMVAATTAIALTAPGAGAAAVAPGVFSGSAEALTLDLSITAPSALLGALGGGATLDTRVSSTISQLSNTVANATSTLLRGTLGNESISDSSGKTTDRKVLAEQKLVGGVVDVGVGTMEFTADATNQVSNAYSELAHLKVSLAPLFDASSPVPAEVKEDLQGAVQDATDTVNGLVGDLNTQLDAVEEAVNEALEPVGGNPVNIDPVQQLLTVPDVTSVDLVSATKLWSRSTVDTEDGKVVSRAVSGLVDLELLGGLVQVPIFQYSSVAGTNGQPGGAFADAVTEVISVTLADNSVIEVTGDTLTVNQEIIDLGELGLDANTLLSGVTSTLGDILASAGLSTLAGKGTTHVAEDGSSAEAATSAFGISLHPLNAAGSAGSGLLGLDLNLLPTRVKAAAANPVQQVQAPALDAPAAPAAPVSLPRTGGGALAILVGVSAMAAAVGLRHKLSSH
ncbi:MAG: hypothetical protein KY462_03670 [Actinobacteria bacterium]|nr:hypothetical protein [Actinomycetota bacterium]